MSRILVAEDEADIRELIAITLQFSGFDVVGVKDGVEAIRAAEDSQFDWILLDVRMPRLGGYETCRHLRQMEKTRGIPIVFLSAKGQESEVEAGLAAGADEYILKPFAPDHLSNRVQAVIEQGQIE